MDSQDTLTLEDVSAILRISRNTLQRKNWRIKTRCPLKKIGRRLLVYKEDFDNWFRGLNG
jgi:Helix-turn-helix domain